MKATWRMVKRGTGRVVVEHLQIADGYWPRLIGLQFRARPPHGFGFLLGRVRRSTRSSCGLHSISSCSTAMAACWKCGAACVPGGSSCPRVGRTPYWKYLPVMTWTSRRGSCFASSPRPKEDPGSPRSSRHGSWNYPSDRTRGHPTASPRSSLRSDSGSLLRPGRSRAG